MKYQHKPTIVEAVQVKIPGNEQEVLEFCEEQGRINQYGQVVLENPSNPDGLIAFPGDYIIKNDAHEVYPCSPDTFRESYEEASD